MSQILRSNRQEWQSKLVEELNQLATDFPQTVDLINEDSMGHPCEFVTTLSPLCSMVSQTSPPPSRVALYRLCHLCQFDHFSNPSTSSSNNTEITKSPHHLLLPSQTVLRDWTESILLAHDRHLLLQTSSNQTDSFQKLLLKPFRPFLQSTRRRLHYHLSRLSQSDLLLALELVDSTATEASAFIQLQIWGTQETHKKQSSKAASLQSAVFAEIWFSLASSPNSILQTHWCHPLLSPRAPPKATLAFVQSLLFWLERHSTSQHQQGNPTVVLHCIFSLLQSLTKHWMRAERDVLVRAISGTELCSTESFVASLRYSAWPVINARPSHRQVPLVLCVVTVPLAAAIHRLSLLMSSPFPHELVWNVLSPVLTSLAKWLSTKRTLCPSGVATAAEWFRHTYADSTIPVALARAQFDVDIRNNWRKEAERVLSAERNAALDQIVQRICEEKPSERLERLAEVQTHLAPSLRELLRSKVLGNVPS